jgi:putative membrane protein
MIKTVLFPCLAALSLVSVASAQPMGGNDHMRDRDGPGAMHGQGPMGGERMTMDFITQAAQSDEFERREGRLAQQRSRDPHVRSFASMMVRAHTMTTMNLKKAIRRAGMTPPPPPALTSDQMRMISDLSSIRGRGFDKTYVDQQVQAHQMTLGLMQNFAQNGRPGPIRDAAAATAPIVQRHLDMARDMQGHMGR